MQHHATYLIKTIFAGTSLALACTGGAALGCGGSGGAEATVDSQLLGIYQISRYQHDPDGCDQPTDINPPGDYVALYSHLPDDKLEPIFLGRFCASVDSCRSAVANFPGIMGPGYSFTQGSDTQGWFGWGIAQRSNFNDQCQYDVQAHALTSPSDGAIEIQTKMSQPIFDRRSEDGTTATCFDADALSALGDEFPCVQLWDLEAEFEANL